MKSAGLLCSFSFFLAAGAFAQVKPPAQPTTGPGGNGYLYGVLQSGPFTVTGQTAGAFSYSLYTPRGLPVSPGNPNPLPTPLSAPVILFLHASGATSTDPYLYWFSHMTQMGFSVVWVEYDQGVSPADYGKAIILDLRAALKKLAGPGLVPPTVDASGKALMAYVGHGIGAWMAYAVAANAAAAQIPIPQAIVAIEPGQNAAPSFNPAKISPSTLVVTVSGDSDGTSATCAAVSVWSRLAQIPVINKPFLLVRSDSHGTPAQLGTEFFPYTTTNNDTDPYPYTVDDRDYNVTYKLSVGAARCAILGQNCDYAQGNGPVNSHGATTQTDMGLWSDGQPVVPLALIPNPPLFFGCRQQ